MGVGIGERTVFGKCDGTNSAGTIMIDGWCGTVMIYVVGTHVGIYLVGTITGLVMSITGGTIIVDGAVNGVGTGEITNSGTDGGKTVIGTM
jgi:hypothetical protein